MAIRNYVGARYVPKFADPIVWQANTSYEAMVIVTYNNSSYTSKIPVPPTVGNPAENSTYWVLTGNYNAQVEEYRQAVADAQEDINELKTKTGTNTNDISGLKTSLTSHINNRENPHGVTKAQVGLGNVDNVSKANILQSVYPVGSIYMSTTSTSPAELFGGTWEQLKDRFLLAAGDTYSAGSTGGESTHILSNDELPPHNHGLAHVLVNDNEGLHLNLGSGDGVVSYSDDANYYVTSTIGGGLAHNNMPPYLAVYAWKRIA